MNATMYSIVETARANHVDARIYLQYLLEKVPIQAEIGNADDPEFLESVMPWGEEYKDYVSFSCEIKTLSPHEPSDFT